VLRALGCNVFGHGQQELYRLCQYSWDTEILIRILMALDGWKQLKHLCKYPMGFALLQITANPATALIILLWSMASS
jgi:hypothetical protein